MIKNWQVILKLGLEGGSISLMGNKCIESSWVFCIKVNDVWNGNKNSDPSEEEIFNTWREAIKALEGFNWTELYPLNIHPEYTTKIWEEIIGQKERPENIFLWRRLCNK